MQDFHKELALAKATIRSSSTIALSHFKANPAARLKYDKSIVTEADEAVENTLRKTFEKEYPSYGVIGEEGEEINKQISWIIDPIDGTRAFARGLQDFAMVVGLKLQHELIFSVIYLPISDELYFAYRNEGAYLNDSKLSVSKETSLEQAIISIKTENIKEKENRDQILHIIESTKTRVTHSAASESALVASGKIDGLVKFNEAIWDVAPACLLMEEAGAIITDRYGDPLILHFSKSVRHSYLALSSSLSETDRKKLYLQKTH